MKNGHKVKGGTERKRSRVGRQTAAKEFSRVPAWGVGGRGRRGEGERKRGAFLF